MTNTSRQRAPITPPAIGPAFVLLDSPTALTLSVGSTSGEGGDVSTERGAELDVLSVLLVDFCNASVVNWGNASAVNVGIP